MLYVVQIITESLPISSSTHLMLAEKLFGLAPLTTASYYLLHGPTLLIIALFFRHAWLTPLVALMTNKRHQKTLFFLFSKIIGYVFIATSIPALFMITVVNRYKQTSWYQSKAMLILGIIITLLCLLSLAWHRKKETFCTLRTALMLGITQALALLPGISRFASTYAIARLLGINHRRAYELCFLIQMPLIIGAFLFYGVVPLLHQEHLISLSWPSGLIIGGASCIAYGALCGMAWLGRNNILWICAGYELILLLSVILFCS